MSIFEHVRFSEKSVPKIPDNNESAEISPSSIFKKARELPATEGSESSIASSGRNILRTGARAAESVIGAPADLVSGISHGLNWVAGKVPGGKQRTKEVEEFTSKLPTSQNIKKWHEQFTGDYLKPQNESQELSDEIFSDAASLLLSPNKGGILLKVGKALGLSTAANVAAKGAAELGVGEEGQVGAKMGTLFLTSLLSGRKGGVNKYKDSLYDEARALRPEKAVVDTSEFNKNLRDLERSISAGGKAPSSVKALEKIKELRKKGSYGSMAVEELEASKRKINELRSGLYDEFKTDKVGRASAKRNLDNVAGVVDSALEKYGKTNPEWLKKYREANQVHGVISQSRKISNFIGRNAKLASGSGAILHALSAVFNPSSVPAVATAVAGGAATLKSAELLYRISKSASLRKYYTNVLLSAAKEDAVTMNKNLQNMAEELEKED